MTRPPRVTEGGSNSETATTGESVSMFGCCIMSEISGLAAEAGMAGATIACGTRGRATGRFVAGVWAATEIRHRLRKSRKTRTDHRLGLLDEAPFMERERPAASVK